MMTIVESRNNVNEVSKKIHVTRIIRSLKIRRKTAVKIVRTSLVGSTGIIFLEGVTDTNRGIIALETNENAA